jgi:hypothetical protein
MQTLKMVAVKFEYREKYPLKLTHGISSLHNFNNIVF